MHLLKSPELRRAMLAGVLLLLAGVVVGSFLSWQAAVLAGVLCAAFLLLFWLVTRRRYRAIAELSCLLDGILHGGDAFPFDDQEEGELAVLRSEIYKMTLTLRHQAELLGRDKRYLADSLADISHQLRTPLTSMNMIVPFLQQPGLTEDRRRELLRDMQSLLSRMDWLMVALLKISRIDAGTVQFERRPVSMRQVVEQAAEPLAVPMELRDQTLRVKGDAGATFTGDQAWTTEAVGNILKNCMEHTPPGGEIWVEYEESALYAQLTVHDSGIGIAPEDLPHVFERFYRGKQSQSAGFGIGLSLARMIVTAQDGTLTAQNHPRGGALFTMKFYKQVV